jgi:hypothetical protein
VLVPGIPDAFRRDVKAGEPLLIVTPQGEDARTNIAAFKMINPGRPHKPKDERKLVLLN